MLDRGRQRRATHAQWSSERADSSGGFPTCDMTFALTRLGLVRLLQVQFGSLVWFSLYRSLLSRQGQHVSTPTARCAVACCQPDLLQGFCLCSTRSSASAGMGVRQWGQRIICNDLQARSIHGLWTHSVKGELPPEQAHLGMSRPGACINNDASGLPNDVSPPSNDPCRHARRGIA